MSRPVLYHNPRCSKSRATAELLTERGIDHDVVRYLDKPLDRDALAAICTALAIAPPDLIRTGETVYRETYGDRTLTTDEALDAMVAHPVLVQRPIVVRDMAARIGRPPELVLDLFPEA